MLHDTLADALSAIKNAELRGKAEVVVRPKSKAILSVLEVFKKNGYIKDYEAVENSRGGEIKIISAGKINNTGAIKPRFSAKIGEFEKFEQRYLPAKDFGLLVVSTPQGVMSHNEAKQKGRGGVLLAYVY